MVADLLAACRRATEPALAAAHPAWPSCPDVSAEAGHAGGPGPRMTQPRRPDEDPREANRAPPLPQLAAQARRDRPGLDALRGARHLPLGAGGPLRHPAR